MNKIKLIRITTVPISLQILLRGQHRYMSQFFEVIGISSSGKALEKVAIEEGIKTIQVEMSRSISPLKDIISLWQLYKIIQKEKPEIVHTHTPKAGTLGMLAAWLCRVPVRMHIVAGLPLLEATGLKRILLDFVEKLTYTCATKVYPNSFGLKDIILQNNYCPASKIHVIGNGSSNGIDTSYFSTEQVQPETIKKLKGEYKIAIKDFVYVFIGRLVADKGINELVTAFNVVYQKHPSAKLLLVGPRESELDPLNNETEQILKNNPAIICTGFQQDVRSFLAVSNVLVFPSYREGFPNVPMQAGAMGLPCIVTNINGCNEIIQDNVNGIIIPPKDAFALENAMIELLDNSEKRERLARNARPLIVERYEQQMIWQLIKQEYDEQLIAALRYQ
ncbi:MAG TPA: glycosyltransferase family 1 protein [Prolixibacteraceae bacterium]|nr:glycosyltransferase family 1 protein [Prolixibacteraceae bacterium]